MGFSITSPRLNHVEAAISKLNIGLVARDSAVIVAEKLVDPLRTAAQHAGASRQMVADIRVHDGHLNELVMRDHGSRGDVIVGVSGEARSADEAEDREWGTLDEPPRAWVRTTAARRAADINRMWSAELTRELDRRVG